MSRWCQDKWTSGSGTYSGNAGTNLYNVESDVKHNQTSTLTLKRIVNKPTLSSDMTCYVKVVNATGNPNVFNCISSTLLNLAMGLVRNHDNPRVSQNITLVYNWNRSMWRVSYELLEIWNLESDRRHIQNGRIIFSTQTTSYVHLMYWRYICSFLSEAWPKLHLYHRALDKVRFACSKILFLPPKPMLWVLKRIVYHKRLFWVPTT